MSTGLAICIPARFVRPDHCLSRATFIDNDVAATLLP
jgi:hypothetical protein